MFKPYVCFTGSEGTESTTGPLLPALTTWAGKTTGTSASCPPNGLSWARSRARESRQIRMFGWQPSRFVTDRPRIPRGRGTVCDMDDGPWGMRTPSAVTGGVPSLPARLVELVDLATSGEPRILGPVSGGCSRRRRSCRRTRSWPLTGGGRWANTR